MRESETFDYVDVKKNPIVEEKQDETSDYDKFMEENLPPKDDLIDTYSADEDGNQIQDYLNVNLDKMYSMNEEHHKFKNKLGSA